MNTLTDPPLPPSSPPPPPRAPKPTPQDRFRAISAPSGPRTSLRQYLNAPMRRVATYPALLRGLAQQVGSGDPEGAVLTAATLQAACDLALDMNSALGLELSHRDMVQTLEKKGFDLAPNRTRAMVLSGKLVKVSSGGPTPHSTHTGGPPDPPVSPHGA
jgi:hypothetical protein